MDEIDGGEVARLSATGLRAAGLRVALVGLPAAGKSEVGAALAGILGLPFLDSDALVEAQAGMSVAAVFAAEGEAGFRSREARVIEGVAAGPSCVLATGGGAVLAAANRELLASAFLVVWLRVGLAAAAERAARAPGTRPLLAGAETRVEAEARIAELARVRDPLYSSVASLALSTEGREPAEIAREIAGEIARGVARGPA